jgi:raffinose/stachyose/melibiose transport system permease protein
MSSLERTTAPAYVATTRKKRDWERTIFIALMLVPAVAFLAFFMYYPIEETFRISLSRSTGLGDSTFIGFENYFRLFRNEEFQLGLLHVFAWAFWSVLIQIPLAFFIAFSVVTYRNRVTKPLRAVYYLASVIPSAITAMLGRFIFSPTYGVISTLAARLGWSWLAGIDFLGDPSLAFWSVFAVATWTYTGFPIIYLMARIEQIPMDIREATELDGANRWQYAWYVVLPMVSYPLRILAVLCTVGSLKLFDLPYMMTTGGPGYATVTLGITLYRQGFVNWQYGKAAAIGVVIFLLSLIFTVALFSFSWGKKGADAE